MKPTDTSEKALEQLIVRHLAGVSEQPDPAANTAGARTPVHAPGGYVLGRAADYSRDVALDVAQLMAFLQATQPTAVAALEPGNASAAENFARNIFSITRQLRYSNDESQRSLDIAIFINGLPVQTFELKNLLTKQTVADAITQYQTDRNPNELVFQEVVALVTIQQLLAQLAPGLIGPKLRPLQARLDELMAKEGLSGEVVAKRIRLLHAGKRKLKIQHFEAVAAATMGRKRIQVKHFNRQTGETLERELSPQHLVHYRDNWYVDAWCHLRTDLRSFAVDALAEAHVLATAAKEVSARSLDESFGAGYGIFNGKPKNIAVLKFSAERARWVRREQWHPQQEGRDEADGGYVLSVPYSDDRELLGDVLRFGEDVEVVGPGELRGRVQKALLAAAAGYV